MTPQDELKELVLENKRLLAENNQLLKKLHRSATRHFWFNIAWIILFLGLPLIAFYKIAMPMYESLGTSPASFSEQLNSIKEIQSLLESQR